MHLAAVYNLFGLNQPLFFAINGAHTAALDHIMVAGSTLGDFWNLPWIVVALVLMRAASESPEFGTLSRWLPAPATSARVLLALVASFLPAAALVGLLKVGLHMPRPPVALPIGTVHVVGKPESPFSFPSGHAAFAMLLTVVLWTHCRRWIRLALIGFTAWVGLSRISLGAHFPVDVAAGYACGAFSAWVGAKVLALRSSTRPRRVD